MDMLLRDHLLRLPDFVIADNREWDAFRLREAISTLVLLSLITWHNSNGEEGLSMHPVTHAWAKDRQTPDQASQAWIATGCVIASSWIEDHEGFWRTKERLLVPHLLSFRILKSRMLFHLILKILLAQFFFVTVIC
jgi:hypothetical protein